MAGEHGGYRRPSNPAPVSGPGALSRRTDGGAATQPPMVANGGPYGSRQEMESIQGGAPMQGAPAGPSAADLRALMPLSGPTANPNEPITAGADAGPGLGSVAAGITNDNDATLDQLRPLVHSLEKMANLPTATPQTRAFVRALKARLAASPQGRI